MLVHPSEITDTHKSWGDKIKDLIKEWKWDLEEVNSDFDDENKRFFKEAYDELTEGNKKSKFSSFQELYEQVPYIIRYVMVKVLNSDPESDHNIDWQLPFNIIIGGNMLDRGYVVKGLVVTYMPRSKGVGNADTMQQRGRFFGYKKNYLNYIKIWLMQDTTNLFYTYTDHEKLLWEDLKIQSLDDNDLDEWKRRFLLSPEMRATRENVIGRTLIKSSKGQSWYIMNQPLSVNSNREKLEEFINISDDYEEFPEPRDKHKPWTASMRCQISKNPVSIRAILESLIDLEINHLKEQAIWTNEVQNLDYLNEMGYKASIILIGTDSSKISEFEKRDRNFNEKGIIKLHQGPSNDHSYDGALKIHKRDKKIITVQLHIFNNYNDKQYFTFAFYTPNKNTMYSEK